MHQRFTTLSLIVLFALSTLTTSKALAQEETNVESEPERPQVEVVFVLDTTGSMGGLLEGAKQKIWSIVNEIAKGKPTPEIKVGLVGYRDKGDDYVTRVHDLSDDLDAIFGHLTAFKAGGGGDGPEHVNQALTDAVDSISWSSDGNTLRIMFLVGDAPPHMDYEDDVHYPETIERAVKKAIIVNAIRCGSSAPTAKTWQEIANLGEGEFLSIDQSGGTVAIATPFDEKLAAASQKLNRTYLAYGTAEERQQAGGKLTAAEKKVADTAAPEASAARAEYRGRRLKSDGYLGARDLVGLFVNDREAFDDLELDELPEGLQELSQEELIAAMEARMSEREAIATQIEELSQQRADFIKAELEKKAGSKDSFDVAVMRLVKEQAEKKGIRYKD